MNDRSSSPGNSLGTWWERFEGLLPPNASAGQRRQMRRAFYAGAAAVVEALRAVTEERVTEEQGVAYIASIDRETRQFAEDLRNGKA